VLAALDHPHIARLLDGGVSPDGLPYFVMEYVDGQPIDAYCDARRLTVEQRLGLFREVCDAVQYAHQRLVVHRDLKPSNILVTEGPGGEPTVKLLDFGIAKVLAPDVLGLSAMLTQPQQRLLTPAYASPEQRDGGAVTTASDVYQLGLLLYELLTGHPALGRARRPEPPLDPVPPSEAVRQTATWEAPDGTTRTASPERVSAARRTPTERLRRALVGDLDTIALMALRPEPERRYDSAAALADDIARHLAGQTVRARPDTLAYRGATFLRRHRWGAGAAALALLVLVAFTAALAVERGRTAREAATARAVADVLGGLFEATNPTIADGDTLTVYDFLRLSEGRLRDDLADQPAVLADVLGVIGGAYRDMTAFARAEPVLREALALQRQVHGPRHDASLDALHSLATLRYMQGALDDALALAREGLALRTQALGADDLRLVPAYALLATVLLQQHRLPDARAVLDEGLALTRPHRAADPRAHLRLVGLESWYYAETEQYPEAVAVAREILALHRRTGAPRTSTALTERILGNLLFQTGDFPEAEATLRRSLAGYREVFGDDNRYTALVLGHLAETAAAAGHAAAADSLFARALPMKVRDYGGDGEEVGYTLLALGRHHLALGRPREAADALARADAIWTATRPPDNWAREQSAALHALARFDLGEPAAADSLEAIWRRSAAEPPGRARAALQLALAGLRQRQGRTAEAAGLRADAAPHLRASPLRRFVEAGL
jgi:serine/threonine-protein kinase